MADLQIERCLPSSRAEGIHALFERSGKTDFARVFERAYRPRESDGLRSWIGTSGGAVVLHISVSPQRFENGAQIFTGGLMGDLMSDEAHRDFWSPIKLARRVVADIKNDA